MHACVPLAVKDGHLYIVVVAIIYIVCAHWGQVLCARGTIANILIILKYRTSKSQVNQQQKGQEEFIGSAELHALL